MAQLNENQNCIKKKKQIYKDTTDYAKWTLADPED